MNKETAENGHVSKVIDFLRLGRQNARIRINDEITRYEQQKLPELKVRLVLGVTKTVLSDHSDSSHEEQREYTYDEWSEAVKWMNGEIARVSGRTPAPIKNSTTWFNQSAELLSQSNETEEYKTEMQRLLIPLSKAIDRWNGANLPLEVAG